MEHDSKLCLSCARAKLAGLPVRACGSCVLLNTDPMAQVRANAARPSPLARYDFSLAPSASSITSAASFGGKRTSHFGSGRGE